MSDQPIVPTSNSPSSERPERYRQSRSVRGGSGGYVTTILLIVVLVGTSLLGWLFWQQSTQLERASQQVAALTDELTTLKQELEVTGSSLAESDTSVIKSIQLWESETRKLWDLYNTRLKTDIAANTASVEQIRSQIGTFQTSLDEIQSNILLSTRSLQDVTDKLNLLSQQVARKASDQDLLIKTNKDTIDAIDRSRSSNNNRILELERKVRELSIN